MSEWAEAVVRARFLVASLGEGASPPWWRSEVTRGIGLRMLERLFPRTAVTASLETASRAAQREHDARIGRGGAFHLFRLPAAEEAMLLDLLRRGEADEPLRALATVGPGERLGELEALAGGRAARGGSGPVYCGPIRELRRGEALAAICAAYEQGFRAGQPVYPYLAEGPA